MYLVDDDKMMNTYNYTPIYKSSAERYYYIIMESMHSRNSYFSQLGLLKGCFFAQGTGQRVFFFPEGAPAPEKRRFNARISGRKNGLLLLL